MGPDVKPLTAAVEALGQKFDQMIALLTQIKDLLEKRT